MAGDPSRRPADWPFPAARAPFYYGWVIWWVSALGILMSAPAQTVGMAMFTDAFIDAFGLTRTALSTAFLVGTVASALLLGSMSSLYDRLSTRFLLAGSSVLLGAVLMAVSGMDIAARRLGEAFGVAPAVFSFGLLSLGYFGLRFAGQGIMTNASRNALVFWFRERLGFVVSLRSVLVSLGFAIAPLLIARLIDGEGWRAALWVLAGAIGLGFAALGLALMRNRPEDIGMILDGGRGSAADRAGEDSGRGISLAEARRQPLFWLIALTLAIHALYGTAVVFHITSLFAETGLPKSQALAYFLPTAVVGVVTNFATGYLSDRLSLKPILIAMLATFLLATGGLLLLREPAGFYMLIVGFGMGGGMRTVLSNVAFVRLFGRGHVGAISGLSQQVSVFAGATGPILFALAHDRFGGYGLAEAACGAVVLGLLAIMLVVPVRERTPERTEI